MSDPEKFNGWRIGWGCGVCELRFLQYPPLLGVCTHGTECRLGITVHHVLVDGGD